MPRRATNLAAVLLAVLVAGGSAQTLRGGREESRRPATAQSIVRPGPGSVTGPKVSALLPDTIHDLAVIRIVAPGNYIAPGTPLNPQVRIRNLGTLPEIAIPIHIKIDSLGNTVYLDSSVVSYLANGDSATYGFPTWLPGPVGNTYQVTAWHSFSPDTNRLNDTLQRLVTTAAAPTVTVTSPNGGESWPAGTLHNITWTSANSGADSVVFSTDGGATWSLVGEQAPPTTRSYAWTVPATLSTNCLVKVSAIGSSTVSDQSDLAFTIAPAETSWVPEPQPPPGAKHKGVGDGGALVTLPGNGDTTYTFLFKGNNTCEFYCYNSATGVWATLESIPRIGSSGKKKSVKQGATLVAAGGKIYATKGNHTSEFWVYTPSLAGAPATSSWGQLQNIPGTTTCGPGTSTATVVNSGTTYIYLLKGGTCEFYRFNQTANTWLTMPSAPGGPQGKAYKAGSAIVYYPDDKDYTLWPGHIYALKGTYNEFYAFRLADSGWVTKTGMPMSSSSLTSVRKTKCKAGAGLAYCQSPSLILALKGNKTQEFWKYAPHGDSWTRGKDVPLLPSGKKVGTGGAISCASGMVFITKGNRTSDFYSLPVSETDDGCGPAVNGLVTNTQGAPESKAMTAGLRISPNPLAQSQNPSISYSLPAAGKVSLELYDITGELVGTLVSGYQPAGSYAYRLSPIAYRLSAGVYVLRLESDGRNATQKLIIE